VLILFSPVASPPYLEQVDCILCVMRPPLQLSATGCPRPPFCLDSFTLLPFPRLSGPQVLAVSLCAPICDSVPIEVSLLAFRILHRPCRSPGTR